MIFKQFIDHLNLNTIRKRLLFYSMLIVMLMLITSVYSFYNIQQFTRRMDEMFVRNRALTELSKNIDSIDVELLNYLVTKSSSSYDNYRKYTDELRKKTENISRRASFDTNILIFKDIVNMIDSYIFEADEAIKARRVGDIRGYNEKYTDAEKISGYIKYSINKLNLNQFEDNTYKYFYMSSKLNMLKKFNMIIIIDTLVLNILFVLWFTNKISQPIINLSEAAGKISQGNFNIDDVNVKEDGEIKVMADAFNNMKNNIRTYIEELHEQAEIEAKLMDEKMQNLKMKNLLKNAELQALQSQINPHFLFNTLNAGVQLAMMEGAEKTGLLLENIASLFRYNLRKMDNPVTLREEIENLHTYIYIMKTRFGDLFSFSINIEDESLLEVQVPIMIIQPLVENAFIHGIGDMEYGGKIEIEVFRKEDTVDIRVKDNGRGMSERICQSILENKSSSQIGKNNKGGHTTGIGIRNVIQRLKTFYEIDEVVEITSKEGAGTIVTLKIPQKGGNSVV